MNMPVVEIENLTKDFAVGFWKKRPMRALDALCLEVREGEIFGFLGPNGAGKSTTIKLLMHLLHPTSGTARILGQSVDSVSMHQHIGYLPENPYFYDYLTPRELLTYVGRLFGLRRKDLSNKVEALIEDVGLSRAANLQLRKFSKGMVQRIGIAQALINDPKIVFLDEPMSGLDPLGRMDVRRIIMALKARGVTVFFSSHILPDVEAICDRVAILNRGRLQEQGALEDILKVRIEGHEVILSGWTDSILGEIKQWCDEIRPMGDRLHLRVTNKENMERLLAFAFSNKLELISLNPIRQSLEDYFQSIVVSR
ncbi:MAG: ABC transporter ATP-binding protein [Acidobacteriota bacterium]|jgi:ABC-2 type transport system ATP-binding protein|nr:ABC transporter ATP-binding protein [Acidobacteriota bacterium]